MATDWQRRQRVANGSRRQRDLAATSFDYGAFVAKHFPNEIEALARAAAWQVHARHHKRKDPDPAEVQKRLEEMGWTRAQMVKA